ncbi:MAG TPA: chaperone modulator CbpM [Flavisolibacter sp.]|jgi:hypothetical protein|nr:chaperone modulator CbpM [Flavisolibacter sp.]
MKESRLVPVQEFCLHYQVQTEFVHSLNEYGLIAIVQEADTHFIDEDELVLIEKLARLHYELQVNMEGLDVICNLLRQLETANLEISDLRNRMQFYQSQSGLTNDY